MSFVWLSILVAGVAIDITTSGFLFTTFSIAALISLLGNTLGLSMIAQFILFAIISILLIVTLVPYIQKRIKNSKVEFVTQENRLIGRELVLKEDLQTTLQVSIDGVFWTIKTESGDIPKDSTVKIVSIDGNKYIVEQI